MTDLEKGDFPPDLDPRDLDEVRRRVVGPVAGALLRGGEAESLDVRIDPSAWPGDDGVSLRLTVCGELFSFWLCDDDVSAVNAELTAGRFFDVLQDEISESRFAWGELREGNYVVPPPP